MTAPTLAPPASDLDVLGQLEEQFKKELPCEFTVEGVNCPNAAEWRWLCVCPTCSFDMSGNVCNPHRLFMVRDLNQPGAVIVCPMSHAVTGAWKWIRL